MHLSGHHRDTLLQLFQHPTSLNVEWRDVLSLLGAVGTVEEQHSGKLLIQIGGETEVLTSLRHKDIDVQLIVDLRRMLAAAGYDAVVKELEYKGKEV